MKLEELFYGAWVKRTDFKYPEQVSAGELKNLFMDIENFGEDRQKEIEEIYNPVPITPEILKNSGFKNWGSYFWDEKIEFRVSKSCINDSIWVCEYGRSKIELRYVHELQNFIKICDYNIEINLWSPVGLESNEA